MQYLSEQFLRPNQTLSTQPFADVLENRSSQKIHKIKGKTTVLVSFFNKVADLLKRESSAGIFL